MNNKISIDHLKFSYDSSRNVIDGLSLNIEQGKKYALVGRSGCGNSTLIRLITGYYSKYEGTIRYNDTEVGDLDLRKITELSSVIHQNIYMFNESIYHNICLHQDFTDQQLEEALKASGSAGFISQMTGGLSHIVGENGANLSGGQKQRVAIAGVVAMHPKCIVLDEPTAMLDPNGRKEVIRAVRALNQVEKVTAILITHYMEEVIYADKVIVMDDGKIVMQGTPFEIFAQVDTLKKYRLDVPQVTLLAHELRKAGVDLPECVLSTEELVKALCQ